MGSMPDFRDIMMSSNGSDDLAMWIIDRNLKIVEASAALCKSLQLDAATVIGKSILELDPIVNISEEARVARLQHIFDTGVSDSMVFWQRLPDRGWTRLISTASKISDQLILNVAHDITDVEQSLLWLRSEILQQFPALIADADGTCLAATLGIAKLCGFERDEELVGRNIMETPFRGQAEQESAMVERSRDEKQPIHTVEWTLSDSGIHQFVITRIALQAGRWMILMQEITGLEPLLTDKPSRLQLAPNLKPNLTHRQFTILQCWWHGEAREDTAARLGIKVGTVDHHRDVLRNLFGVALPRDVLNAVRGTLLAQLLDQSPLAAAPYRQVKSDPAAD